MPGLDSTGDDKDSLNTFGGWPFDCRGFAAAGPAFKQGFTGFGYSTSQDR
jgi:hypothetical protein